MFIQVIEGKVRDAEALHRCLEVWERELMPGAIGYLGSTGGCTSAGDCILIARFESQAAARRNAERPEQTAWWMETEKCFDGPARFHDTTDVHVMQHGDLNRAHFVQAMEGHVTDKSRVEEIERRADQMLGTMRPDLLGTVTAFFDDGDFTELAYFTDEGAARDAEKQMPTGEAKELFDEFQRVMKVERYIDLRDPWLVST